MKVIGITGGVGAGKSQVLSCISELCNCYVIFADKLAKELEKKGQCCYEPLIDLLGQAILDDDGQIDTARMARAIFESGNDQTLKDVNAIIHPRVKKYIIDCIENQKNAGVYDYFFIEAALLIEERYDLICDELWYIYADEHTRRDRLRNTRGYSDSKIDGIFKSQLTEAEFRNNCKYTIDNSGAIEDIKEQIEAILEKERD